MNGENEFGLRPLAPDEIDRLRQLATAVKVGLSRSGLVVRDAGEEPDRQMANGGLEIDLDQFDDEAGGLWLTWELHPAVRRAVREAVRDTEQRSITGGETAPGNRRAGCSRRSGPLLASCR